MKRRGNPHPHRYKHGKIDKAIDLGIFSRIIDNVDKVTTDHFDSLFIKSLLAILYWTGLRKTEVIGAKPHRYVLKPCNIHKIREEPEVKFTEAITGILKEDIWIKEGFLYVDAIARKRGKRKGPLAIPLSQDYVYLIVEQWEMTEPKQKVWAISESHAWRLMKRLAPKLYLHFFRFNRVTKFAGNPNTSIRQICSWTGMTAQTVDAYLERSGRYSKELGETMREET